MSAVKMYNQPRSDDVHGACCRWPGTVLPVVKFVNGREEVLVPETFTADVAAVGVCKRLQV